MHLSGYTIVVCTTPALLDFLHTVSTIREERLADICMALGLTPTAFRDPQFLDAPLSPCRSDRHEAAYAPIRYDGSWYTAPCSPDLTLVPLSVSAV